MFVKRVFGVTRCALILSLMGFMPHSAGFKRFDLPDSKFSVEVCGDAPVEQDLEIAESDFAKSGKLFIAPNEEGDLIATVTHWKGGKVLPNIGLAAYTKDVLDSYKERDEEEGTESKVISRATGMFAERLAHYYTVRIKSAEKTVIERCMLTSGKDGIIDLTVIYDSSSDRAAQEAEAIISSVMYQGERIRNKCEIKLP